MLDKNEQSLLISLHESSLELTDLVFKRLHAAHFSSENEVDKQIALLGKIIYQDVMHYIDSKTV
jgi:hypothetical protein